jgi:hypothetical protein
MRPGELIEIRTPHAVAGVRGTVVVAEVVPGPDGRLVSRFTVLKGMVEVVRLTPSGTTPAPVSLAVRDRVELDHAASTRSKLSEDGARRLAETFRVPPAAPSVAIRATSRAHLHQAASDAAALADARRKAELAAHRKARRDDAPSASGRGADDDSSGSPDSARDDGSDADRSVPPSVDAGGGSRGPGPTSSVDDSRGSGSANRGRGDRGKPK